MAKEKKGQQNGVFLKGVRGSDSILNYREPQIVFIGRSNVGKSSTINALTNNSKLARASGTPGKTQEMNFFLVNKSHLFVDLPGYGYARLAPDLAEKLRKMIIWYFTGKEATPALTVLIIDAKVGITEYDNEMIAMLRDEGHRFIILANKIDKLNQKERSLLERSLPEKVTDADIFFFSAKDGTGVKEVHDLIFSIS